MSTSQTLLGLLEIEPAHGYTLKQRYDAQFPHAKPLAFGQVYAALDRFEKRGLAEVLDIESGAGPERRRFTITPDGVTAVDLWVGETEPPTGYASSALFAKLSIALLSGRDAQAVLFAQREVHLVRMRELTVALRAAGAVEAVAVTFDLNHLDADLRWIDEAGRRLAEMRRAVTRHD
jgi:DNA-binding PadR family transcriptional regulator